ncbi:MAG: acetolactate synthase large subunit [Myxococcales bacterium]|nr:acetolactate synthase large subunit [Myxococcales bacterium]
MNGAQSLIRTLVDSGLDVCFTNPGTSEMHFVAALDSVPQMRPVLCLFEGVASGAADGYGRMADRPACTLLHLGPGLTNALANVHNARKARVPMLNVVGDHAVDHKQYDAPLTSDVEGLAAPLSHFLRTTKRSANLAADAAEAALAARTPPGQIATLVLPADVSWGEAGGPAAPLPIPARTKVDEARVEAAASALRSGEKAVILMNGQALRAEGLKLGSRVANASGARLMCDTFTGRLERGAGRAVIERLPYFGEMVAGELAGVRHLVLVGSQEPVSFFAYPGKPSYLVPEGCSVHRLAEPGDDMVDALARLADALKAPADGATIQQLAPPAPPTGALDAKAVGLAIAAHMPEGAIVADEGNTEGFLTPIFSAGAPPHDWLSNTGGSIGLGLPMATGAAVACPDRKVIALEGDGSAMYTVQALWTQARENLNVVNVILANRSYRILNIELERVGAEGAGPRARSMFDLGNPQLDFVTMARSMGVPANRATDAEGFSKAFARAVAEPGPSLIEAVLVG